MEVSIFKPDKTNTSLSDLHEDVIYEIITKIKFYKDFLASSQICRSWRLVTQCATFFDPVLLMLPSKARHNFFIPSKSTTYSVKSSCLRHKKYYSSKGWLMTISKKKQNIELLHRHTLDRIQLPSAHKFENSEVNEVRKPYIFYIAKFLLIGNPLSSSDYRVVVLYSGCTSLAYYKPGDYVWTTIDTSPFQNCFYDMTVHQGLLYGLLPTGVIMVCDIYGDHPIQAHSVVKVKSSQLQLGFFTHGYIVESGGKLLVVSRVDALSDNERPVQFQVFEVNLENNSVSQIKELGNRCLFLGQNSSFSFESSSVKYFKSNCIYFADDWEDLTCREKGEKNNIGIYNLEDGSITPILKDVPICTGVNPPIWLENCD